MLAALLLLAGSITYANSLSGPFIFDDGGTVLDNPQIRDLGNLSAVFSPPPETSVAGRPIANLTFAVNYALGGLHVGGYHLVNLACHLLAALLVFGLVRRTLQAPTLHPAFLSRATSIGFAVALIWTVHPLTTEVVDYLSERTESLMAIFYLLTLYAAVRATEPHHRGMWTLLAVVSCALGMGCKESMVTAPLMVMLYDWAFVFDSWRAAFRARRRLYVALAATWAVLVLLLLSHPRTLSAGFSAPGQAPWTYLLNQAVVVTHYLKLVIWPKALVLYYGWPRPMTLGEVWPSAAWIGCLGLVTVVALVRRPALGFLTAWAFITLAPSSSIVPIVTEVGAERRMYLPLIAIVALAVIGTVRAWDLASDRWRLQASARATRLAGVSLLVLVSLALAGRTVARNREFASSLTLAETSLARWPTPAAESMVGQELGAANRFADAIPHLRAAAPTFLMARYYLGLALATEGHTDEAIVELRDYVDHELPEITQAQIARVKIADLLMQQRRWAEAADAYRAVLAVRPDDAHALGALAVALISNGKIDDAVPVFQRIADADPQNSHAQQNLAQALASRGDFADATRHARQAVTLSPREASAHELLGRLLAAQGQLVDAKVEFELALNLDPASPAREGLRRLGIRTPQV